MGTYNSQEVMMGIIRTDGNITQAYMGVLIYQYLHIKKQATKKEIMNAFPVNDGFFVNQLYVLASLKYFIELGFIEEENNVCRIGNNSISEWAFVKNHLIFNVNNRCESISLTRLS